ncbi:hypothetical protein DV736_g5359, partial [Chaetothyriales sp. CBS 134916]
MASGDEMDVDGPGAAAESQGVLIDPAAREKELDERYPNRPRNHSPTLPFHTLFQDLFQPLIEEQKGKSGASGFNRRRLGSEHVPMSKQERKRMIIERYISRWRSEVGDDFYPAFRLIVPDKDRERAMYGLKEKALGKYLIKIMKIDKNSADASKILHWKVPVEGSASGDFPSRCYEVMSQRPSRVEPGDMTIEEVNEKLDVLSAAAREASQLPIMAQFYQRMNAEEMKWLIRIILRDMKIGSTEKTFFHLWHPDAESLFNISSNLRRVCWELYDPNVRLEREERGVALMSCFQPQLAAWQVKSFQQIVDRMQPTENDNEFYIEEKLDGERMQLHMRRDEAIEGGRRFRFWSRKAKDYTYLYGEGLKDEKGSLTKYLKEAFAEDVDSIILDGEMITWDPEQDRQGAFGTLKTAANNEKTNPYAGNMRPLFRVFDVLLVNGTPVTNWVLRKRREIISRSIKPVHRRLEIHEFAVATKADEITPFLHKVIEEAGEGLVIKNPRSVYSTGERNNSWIKVKPEYMQGQGEEMECCIIAGYYGSGRRGGGLSSFMCGLREDESAKSQRFCSFFKVGGGMRAEDYAAIKHLTEGKWHDYDPKKAPKEYLRLTGAPRERPDQWIKPEDSVIVTAKAAEITPTEDFAMRLTLRFPRFVNLRSDKDWKTAMSVQDLENLQATRAEKNEKAELEADERRKKRRLGSQKRPLKVVGYGAKDVSEIRVDDVHGHGKVFEGLAFFVMTDSTKPMKKTKPQLEAIIKDYGGRIVQTHAVKGAEVVCIAERRTVKVASLQKKGDTMIVKPRWLFDCIEQAKKDFASGMSETTLLWEVDRHLFFVPEAEKRQYEHNVDQYGDAYYRDTTADELRELMSQMPGVAPLSEPAERALTDRLEGEVLPGWMFKGMTVYFDLVQGSSDGGEVEAARTTAAFAGAKICSDLDDWHLTHIVVSSSSDVKALRKKVSTRPRIPYLVKAAWILDSWRERTLLAEERFIWRHLLRLDHNREPHSRPVPDGAIQHLLRLDSRRILEAPQFRHKGKQEINGVLPLTYSCRLHPAILRTCRTIYAEATSVLYVENKVFAVQCGIRGLGARLRNYGIPTFGPIASSRLYPNAGRHTAGEAVNDDVGSSRSDSRNDGRSDSRSDSRNDSRSDSSSGSSSNRTPPAFDPVILFKGHSSRPSCPYYICSHRDGQNLMHALWIMVKCPFARAMRFDIYLTASAKYHSLPLADKFVRGSLLPWMHNHIDAIGMDDMADARRVLLQSCLDKHRKESVSKPNVYTYNTVCGFLEQVKDAADAAVDNGHYTRAEDLYELVSYEACSIVRTRTGKLVDVSTKTTNGINRVCKLVAISAFRLCELRSGAITAFKQYNKSALATPCGSPKTEVTEEQALDIPPKQGTMPTPPDAIRLKKPTHHQRTPAQTQTQMQIQTHPQSSKHPSSGTTRLKGVVAIEHAIMAGLLALRLPCATPIPEWNIRLNLMLLYLFTQYGDLTNALLCIRHLHTTCDALMDEARTKDKKGLKWDCLAALVNALSELTSRKIKDKERKRQCQVLVEQGQDCVRRLWGERLQPKKSYTGLIWTFRWA